MIAVLAYMGRAPFTGLTTNYGLGFPQPDPIRIDEATAEAAVQFEPVRVAEVRARVAGIVLRRQVEEGADVRAGQVLFQIDPAPFKAALSRAQGELARAEAQGTAGEDAGEGAARADPESPPVLQTNPSEPLKTE